MKTRISTWLVICLFIFALQACSDRSKNAQSTNEEERSVLKEEAAQNEEDQAEVEPEDEVEPADETEPKDETEPLDEVEH